MDVSRVATEPELCEQAINLCAAVQNNRVLDYCNDKLTTVEEELERKLWDITSVDIFKVHVKNRHMVLTETEITIKAKALDG